MSEAIVMDIARQTIQVALMVAAPMLIVSLVVGLTISLFQVATSLQDVTLTFVPKITAVGLTLLLAAHWIIELLLGFCRNLIQSIPEFIS